MGNSGLSVVDGSSVDAQSAVDPSEETPSVAVLCRMGTVCVETASPEGRGWVGSPVFQGSSHADSREWPYREIDAPPARATPSRGPPADRSVRMRMNATVRAGSALRVKQSGLPSVRSESRRPTRTPGAAFICRPLPRPIGARRTAPRVPECRAVRATRGTRHAARTTGEPSASGAVLTRQARAGHRVQEAVRLPRGVRAVHDDRGDGQRVQAVEVWHARMVRVHQATVGIIGARPGNAAPDCPRCRSGSTRSGEE